MTVYVLNSPIITDYGLWRLRGPIDAEQASDLLRAGFVSAVGHAGAARFLSELLALEIPFSRIQTRLEPGDCALVLRLKLRLPENTTLDHDHLRSWPHELALLERLE